MSRRAPVMGLEDVATQSKDGRNQSQAAGDAEVHLVDRTLPARCIDVSQTGVALTVPGQVLEGAYLSVRFRLRLSIDGRDVLRPLQADGVVVRAISHGFETMLGVEFTVVDTHVLERIAEYVAVYGVDESQVPTDREPIDAVGPTGEFPRNLAPTVSRRPTLPMAAMAPVAHRRGVSGQRISSTAIPTWEPRDDGSTASTAAAPAESDRRDPNRGVPGFPGGPASAPVTGEFGVDTTEPERSEPASTGTDDDPVSDIDPELIGFYFDAATRLRRRKN